MQPKISILIPSIVERSDSFKALKFDLQQQRSKLENPLDIQILTLVDNKERSIGFKRNWLVEHAAGEYMCFIDDDDIVHEKYIEILLAATKTGADCCSFIGEYFQDGKFDRLFYHSLKYNRWYDDALGYYRYPNHLNCIKRDLVKDIFFPETNFGEDHNWSTTVHSLGRLQTEAEIPMPIYKYMFKSKK